MVLRERILAVYRGEKPDVVPYMLDLSHWFYHRTKRPWDLSISYTEPEYALIDFHKRMGAGFYMPNLASFYSVSYPETVKATTRKRNTNSTPEIIWHLETSRGCIERTRVWKDQTYSWGIRQWGICNEQDLLVFKDAMAERTFSPHWDRYEQWRDYVGEDGVVYISPGYSAMGLLLNYWMGVEATVYATIDYPELLHEVVDAVNKNILIFVDLLTESPAEVVIMGDNFSSDIQPPSFFDEWSRPFYEEAIRRLHGSGKFVAVHIDGKLKGAIEMIRTTQADCADAVTPTPMGDLSPDECRSEAGAGFILSGGVSPDLWLPETPVETFEAKVLEWLAQKHQTFRLIAGAGDQVPPGAEERRIALMRDLVEEHGGF